VFAAFGPLVVKVAGAPAGTLPSTTIPVDPYWAK